MLTQRTKLLHLITELAVGGAQDNTLATVARLDRDRYAVDLAGGPGGAWEARARTSADHVYIIRSLRRNVSPMQDLAATAQIFGLLRRERYHILHTHSSKAGVLGRVAGRLARVPIIVHTVHGFAFDDTTFSPLERKLFVLLERLAAKSCSCMITNSEMTRQAGLAERIAPAYKMMTIHSGIDLAPFAHHVDPVQKRRELGLDPERPIVGMVGRLAESTAPVLFIDAACRILEVRPEVQFLVVGDGPLAGRMRERVASLSAVRLAGLRADIPEVLQALDCFVSPSAWGAIGRALTEAMIAGLPVVATDIRGVREIVKDGETGFVVPVGDAAAVASRVLSILQDRELSQRLGHAARTIVVPEFSADLMVQRIARLYESLLPAKGVA